MIWRNCSPSHVSVPFETFAQVGPRSMSHLKFTFFLSEPCLLQFWMDFNLNLHNCSLSRVVVPVEGFIWVGQSWRSCGLDELFLDNLLVSKGFLYRVSKSLCCVGKSSRNMILLSVFPQKSTSELQAAIQLGIGQSVGGLSSKPERDLLMQDFGVVQSVVFPK